MAVKGTLLAGGGARVENSSQPDQGSLIFTQAEWEAFIGGAQGGEFDRFGQHAQEGDGTRTHEG
jgi:hypothetical protein